ncbi:MAG: hypothetical protein R3F24_00170 [Gammaproteobacteria bacterium]
MNMKLTARAWIFILCSIFALPAASATAPGFDAASFKTFVDMRVGTGQPVYWYCIGTVYAYPGGEPLMTMEGIDTARRWHDPAEPAVAKQLSRKTFIYRDLDTNRILTSINGKPLAPIEYPYQFITYQLVGNRVQSFVEQGRGPQMQRIGPVKDIEVRRAGEGYIFTAPIFLDMPMTDGERYQAFENYDFIVPAADSKPSDDRLSWLRYGDIPGVGKTIMHLVAWRVDSYAELPLPMRNYLEENARLWMQPPADIAEIRQLQAAPAP